MRMATAKRGVVRDAWSIARVYWASEEKWSAWGLLLAVVALNLGTVCTSVGINAWNRGFYNALQAFDRGQIFRQLGVFFILGSLGITLSVYAVYMQQMLQYAGDAGSLEDISTRGWLIAPIISCR
jgi:vitamin B12/bleomycin/antimicrobial peptide transport system ATP-binding/permease protein